MGIYICVCYHPTRTARPGTRVRALFICPRPCSIPAPAPIAGPPTCAHIEPKHDMPGARPACLTIAALKRHALGAIAREPPSRPRSTGPSESFCAKTAKTEWGLKTFAENGNQSRKGPYFARFDDLYMFLRDFGVGFGFCSKFGHFKGPVHGLQISQDCHVSGVRPDM